MKTVHVHVPYPKIEDYLAHLRKNSLNLEIYFPSSSLDDLGPDDLQKLRLKLDYNPSLSIHAPFMDMSPGAVDSKVREVTFERFSQVMDIAEVLSPKSVVFHSGYEKWKYAHRVDIWMDGSLRTWRPLIERASALGVRIAIENIFEDEPSNLRLLMKELHSDNFGICLDTGHCNLFTSVPLEEWIDSLKPYIYELHLHDNDKTFDQHLPVGDGTFDFKRLFAALEDRDDCLYTVEAHSPGDVLKSIERLRGYVGG